MKKSNVITAAIDLLGGGSTGVKRVGVLLDLTTQRVYQLADRGLVRKPEHAAILSDATGIPFDAFLIRDRWTPPEPPPTGTDDQPEGHKPPKASPPLAIVGSSASSTGASEGPRVCLGGRLGRYVRPAKGKRTHRPDSRTACSSRSKSRKLLAA